MMPINKKCAVNSNYSMTSWQTPSDIIQLSSEEEVNSGGCTDRDAIYGEGGGGECISSTMNPTLRGIVVLVFTKSFG